MVKASKAISKTKLRAFRRKGGVGTGAIFKAKTDGKPREVLLGQLMERHLADDGSATSYADIMSGLGMNDRNTPWRKAWQEMNSQGLTNHVDSGGFYTSGFQLTAKGREEASTDEMKEIMAKTTSNKPKTNEELHAQIKSKLMNKRGEQIFDLLLHHGPQSRKELARHLKISDTGAYFSYALQQLKDLGYADNVAGKGRAKEVSLTDKSFIDRKEFVPKGKNSIKQEVKTEEAGTTETMKKEEG